MIKLPQVILAATVVTMPLVAQAAGYPNQSVRAIVSNAPGTGTDGTTRFVANELSKQWGVPVVVENRPGAGGVIATDYAARTPADGYHILFTTGAHYSFPATIAKPSFDARNDFTLVAGVAQAPMVLFVAADSPYKTVQDVVDAARKAPDNVSFASPGAGTSSHLAAVMMMSQADVEMLHVPYKSASQAALEVASGQAQVGFNGTGVTLPLLHAGKIRMLAVTGSKRSASLPDVPTMDESGLKGYEFVTPILAVVPAGTSQPIVDTIGAAIKTAVSQPEFAKFCLAQGLDVAYKDPAQLKAAQAGEFEKAKKLVELAGLKAR